MFFQYPYHFPSPFMFILIDQEIWFTLNIFIKKENIGFFCFFFYKQHNMSMNTLRINKIHTLLVHAKIFQTSDLLFLFQILATLISISYAHNQGWLRWSPVCLEFSWICCAQWTTRRWPRWGLGGVLPTPWQRWLSQAAKEKLQTQSSQEYLCLKNM